VDVKTTCVQSIDTCMTLRGDVWAHKTSLTWPCFIEVPVLRQESEQSCTCGFGYRFYFVSTISRLDFETVLTIQYFMYSQYSILCSDNTVFYVLCSDNTVFYVLCFDNTVFYVLIIQYFMFYVLTIKYFMFYVLTIQYFMFWQYSILCSDNTVFYVFHFIDKHNALIWKLIN
jgi:hypothetical protein